MREIFIINNNKKILKNNINSFDSLDKNHTMDFDFCFTSLQDNLSVRKVAISCNL